MTDIASIITQLEQQKTAIENAIAALRAVSGESTANGPKGRTRKTQGGTRTDGRQRQIEAMRRYRAAKKAGAKKGAAKKATKKGGLTAAGRKALSENMKRLWAEKRVGN